MIHEYLCDLLSTIEAKYEKKRSEIQINKIDSDRVSSIFDSNKSVSITRKKKSRTGVLLSNRGPQKKAQNV